MEKGLVQLKFFNLENHNFYKIPRNFLARKGTTEISCSLLILRFVERKYKRKCSYEETRRCEWNKNEAGYVRSNHELLQM